MGKPKISLNAYNDKGCIAYVENVSENDEVTVVLKRNSRNAEKVCVEAARVLHELAYRFEMLAKEEKPFVDNTQRAINQLKL